MDKHRESYKRDLEYYRRSIIIVKDDKPNVISLLLLIALVVLLPLVAVTYDILVVMVPLYTVLPAICAKAYKSDISEHMGIVWVMSCTTVLLANLITSSINPTYMLVCIFTASMCDRLRPFMWSAKFIVIELPLLVCVSFLAVTRGAYGLDLCIRFVIAYVLSVLFILAVKTLIKEGLIEKWLLKRR